MAASPAVETASNLLSMGVETCSIGAMAPLHLQVHFATLEDPRVDRTRRHDLSEIAEKIVDGGANHPLALGANHPTLHQELVAHFEHAQQDRTIDERPLATHETADEGHGRLETRRVWCSDNLEWMSEQEHWKGLRTIVMIERERIIADKTSLEIACSLSSRAPDAARIGGLARRHWSIENELHWVLDMVFEEDQSRNRDRNAVTNLALLRKLALALLDRERSDPRMSIRMKRRRVGRDDDYPFTVLGTLRAESA